MAKKKEKTDDEELKVLIAKEEHPEHFEPQKENDGPVRPEAVDPKHLLPQE